MPFLVACGPEASRASIVDTSSFLIALASLASISAAGDSLGEDFRAPSCPRFVVVEVVEVEVVLFLLLVVVLGAVLVSALALPFLLLRRRFGVLEFSMPVCVKFPQRVFHGMTQIQA